MCSLADKVSTITLGVAFSVSDNDSGDPVGERRIQIHRWAGACKSLRTDLREVCPVDLGIAGPEQVDNPDILVVLWYGYSSAVPEQAIRMRRNAKKPVIVALTGSLEALERGTSEEVCLLRVLRDEGVTIVPYCKLSETIEEMRSALS